MSAYVTLMTPMVDQECLLLALAELGYDQSRVEIHDVPKLLVGYEGTTRFQSAHLILRREFVGPASNDVGFLKQATGYRLIVSEFDQNRFGQGWLARLSASYNGHSAAKAASLERAAREAAEIEARRKAEAERIRMEEERRRLVESQRLAVHEKAKKMGYQIKETREGDVLRLVLVKRTY